MEVGTEPVGKVCDVVETDVICVPPITTTPLDGLRSLFSRGSSPRPRPGAGRRAAAGNAAACSGPGWFGRLTRGGGGGVRRVESLTSREYECGTRCVYEWSAVRVDARGRPIRERDEDPADDAEAQPDAEQPGPGEAPPPAPAPAPAPDFGGGTGEAAASPVPPKTGVAGQAVDR